MNKTEKNNTWAIIKYVLGFLGILGVVTAILTISNTLDNTLSLIGIERTINNDDKIVISLLSSILGILFIFIAFSKYIDRFFNVIERKEIKLSKDEEHGGISIELMFFLIIAIALIVLAILIGIDYLVVTELPLLGEYTEKIIVGSLIVLSLLAIVTAFNEIIGKSIKEMKKVHWPTSKQMTKFSAQVFSFIIFFSVLFLLLDLIVNNGITGLDNLID